MCEVKVIIPERDRKVGAMVKALAVEVAGFQAVKGTTKDFLRKNGYYVFHFLHASQAEEFRRAVQDYIPRSSARAEQSTTDDDSWGHD